MQELAKWLRGEACGGSNWNEKINKAADLIESQAAEIAELDALRNDAVLRLGTYKALCDQMATVMTNAVEHRWPYLDDMRSLIEAWRAMK